MSELLTTSQAADLLDIERDTVRRQIHLGRIKAERFGRDWLIERAEIVRYDQDRRRGPTRAELRRR